MNRPIKSLCVALFFCGVHEVSAQESLCGAGVTYKLAPVPSGTPENVKAFHGVWGPGEWASGTCHALVVTDVTPNGQDVKIVYIYGVGPQVPHPGSFTKADATIKGDTLKFKSSPSNSDVEYKMVNGTLQAWFTFRGGGFPPNTLKAPLAKSMTQK